ncbi:MAG: alternative ribosome rescue aminoacyl-tRNA hydrolase ArfB [Candidatus Nanopelagicales bacterium]
MPPRSSPPRTTTRRRSCSGLSTRCAQPTGWTRRPPDVMEDVGGDLPVTARLVIPAAELRWRFSRSSGPGGQSVNTTDSRVSVTWDSATSSALTPAQRDRVRSRWGDSVVTVVAAEHRSQWQNRRSARLRLAEKVATALAPPPRRRRATRPSRSSVERRLAAKRRRSSVKRDRTAPESE